MLFQSLYKVNLFNFSYVFLSRLVTWFWFASKPVGPIVWKPAPNLDVGREGMGKDFGV